MTFIQLNLHYNISHKIKVQNIIQYFYVKTLFIILRMFLNILT